MLTPTVLELTFEPNAPLDFKAGQFISIIVPGAGPGGRNLRRAYSIASPPGALPIELCVKLVEGGPGTNYLYKLRPGDEFKGFAPYGTFVYKPATGRHVCFSPARMRTIPSGSASRSRSMASGGGFGMPAR